MASTPNNCDISHHHTEFKSAYGVYSHAAVASDSKICSEIGKDVMQALGGNAIDAAVATSLATTVIYPHSTGIGGGLLATLYHNDHGWCAVDARGTAPSRLEPGMFSTPADASKALGGALSICVPGYIRGLVDMHKRFGSLPWSTVVEPALKLLRHGHPISNQTYYALVRTIAPSVVGMKGFEMYLDDVGRVKPPGSIVTNPLLARTLQTISDDPSSFYNGPLADDIIRDIQDAGGIIQAQDLEVYEVRLKDTLHTDLPGGGIIQAQDLEVYEVCLKDTLHTDLPGGGIIQAQDLEVYEVRLKDTLHTDLPGGLTLHSGPPPAAGASLNHIMAIMAGYNMTPDSIATEEARLLTHHRFLEASRFSMARKMSLGDEDYVDVKQLVEDMTSRSYGEATRKQIDDSTTLDLDSYGAKFDLCRESGTSHSSILDKDGNAVSITGTLDDYFGSLVIGTRTGIAFNNGIKDFSHLYQNNYLDIPPSRANMVAAGKRPRSSMCPAIVWDGKRGRVCLVTGAAGDIKIPEGLARTMTDVLYFGLSVPESIDQPKIYQELLPPILMADDGLSPAIKRGLEGKGHVFLRLEGFTVIQMIQKMEDGSVVAGCDYRKGGQPSGF